MYGQIVYQYTPLKTNTGPTIDMVLARFQDAPLPEKKCRTSVELTISDDDPLATPKAPERE